MSLISSLTGRPSVQEFTGVGAMPATIMPLGVRLRQKKLMDDPKDPKKKKIKEDGLIPDEVIPLSPESGLAVDDPKNVDLEKEGDLEKEDEFNAQGKDGELLTTDLALVAPDATPNWNMPLSPTLVPSATSPATSTSEAPVFPSTDKAADVPMSVEGMLGLGRGARNSKGVATTSILESKSEGDLVAQGKPMPDHVMIGATSKVLGKFNFRE